MLYKWVLLLLLYSNVSCNHCFTLIIVHAALPCYIVNCCFTLLAPKSRARVLAHGLSLLIRPYVPETIFISPFAMSPQCFCNCGMILTYSCVPMILFWGFSLFFPSVSVNLSTLITCHADTCLSWPYVSAAPPSIHTSSINIGQSSHYPTFNCTAHRHLQPLPSQWKWWL